MRVLISYGKRALFSSKSFYCQSLTYLKELFNSNFRNKSIFECSTCEASCKKTLKHIVDWFFIGVEEQLGVCCLGESLRGRKVGCKDSNHSC